MRCETLLIIGILEAAFCFCRWQRIARAKKQASALWQSTHGGLTACRRAQHPRDGSFCGFPKVSVTAGEAVCVAIDTSRAATQQMDACTAHNIEPKWRFLQSWQKRVPRAGLALNHDVLQGTEQVNGVGQDPDSMLQVIKARCRLCTSDHAIFAQRARKPSN